MNVPTFPPAQCEWSEETEQLWSLKKILMREADQGKIHDQGSIKVLKPWKKVRWSDGSRFSNITGPKNVV